MKRHGYPNVLVTDKLRSYGADHEGNHRQRSRGRKRAAGGKQSRAENSHLPFRRRERAMLRFRQMNSLQKLVRCSFFRSQPL